MTAEPDVRLDGVTHEKILEWVRQGKAGSATHILGTRLLKVINALQDAAHKVNSAVQHAADGWEGSAADSATVAMSSLRDFDDQLHTHGRSDWDSAAGQSGESAATRNRMPPIPLHLDAQPTILGSTVDPKFRIDARRQAEEHAREILAEYQEATRHRLATLPPIAHAPTVVLDTSTHEPGGSGAPVNAPRQAAPTAPVPTSNGGRHAAAKPRTSASATSATKPVESPGQDPETRTASTTPQATGQTSAGASSAAGQDPVTTGNPLPGVVIGGIAAVPTGHPATVGGAPVGTPEVIGPGGGGQRPGEEPKSGAEKPVERQPIVRREPGGGRVGGQGPGGLLGGAAGPHGDKDEEHHNRYHLPSGEPFDAGEVEYDGEFFVVPDVIGGPE
jgi:hypothetical protein